MNTRTLTIAGGLGAASLGLTALLALPSQAAPAPTVAHASVPECTSADLTAHFHPTDAAMSHRFGTLVLTNVSRHACRTGGYGGLSYVGHGNGTQIGAAAQRDRSGAAVRTLVLKPGQRARSAVSEAVAQVYPRRTCRPVHVDGFRVYPPNETHSLYVKHPTTGCANPKVHLLSHQAYR